MIFHVFGELFQCLSDIVDLLNDYFSENRYEVWQRNIILFTSPCGDGDTISGLQFEIGSYIVYDDGFGEVSIDKGQIFDGDKVLKPCMLSVESVGDALLFWLEWVQYGIGILFDGGGEDDDLVVSWHLVEELLTVGTHEEWYAALSVVVVLCLSVVDEGLVHVQDKSVLFVALQWGKKGWLWAFDHDCKRTCEDGVQWDEHCLNLFYLVSQLYVLICQYFKHKGLQWIKPTVGEDGFDDLHKGFVVFGQ